MVCGRSKITKREKVTDGQGYLFSFTIKIEIKVNPAYFLKYIEKVLWLKKADEPYLSLVYLHPGEKRKLR